MPYDLFSNVRILGLLIELGRVGDSLQRAVGYCMRLDGS